MARRPHTRRGLRAAAVAAAVGAAPFRCRAAARLGNEVTVGDVRVQALSARLLRVEPRGPLGFEDESTFVVVERGFPGLNVSEGRASADGALLKTEHYDVLLRRGSTGPRASCDEPADSTAVEGGVPAVKYNNARGALVADQAGCCSICETEPTCMAWVYTVDTVGGLNCWPYLSYGHTVRREGAYFGLASRMHYRRPSFVVTAPGGGRVLYDADSDPNPAPHLLHWPAPLQARAYAFVDRPRFRVPRWGPAPIPTDARVDPDLEGTHGYDFRNVVDGDTYVFLLGDSLEDWQAARAEFLKLTGPTPLLPDFAFGTWFSWFHPYTEQQCKTEIRRWRSDRLPLDVWGLDMDWRRTDGIMFRSYHHPNTTRFPDLPKFLAYLHRKHGLHSYFNDHPSALAGHGAGGLQTSPEEMDFRWQGLTFWLSNGLTFWWFDPNWWHSIPPPFVNTTKSFHSWKGLSNVAWGSHLYYETTKAFDHSVRDRTGNTWYGGRPLLLSKYGRPDWRTGFDPHGHAESPAQHRYPVWWTGDWMDLMGSVETMVDAGVHDLKPYVHSDCGGSHRFRGGDLVRWVAHCAFGTIVRIHGSDHRPWTHRTAVEDAIRRYLTVRYKLLPSIIGAGQRATRTGFPLAARCDLYWPELAPASSTNRQYIFLEDLLVAPMDTMCQERSGPKCGKDGLGMGPSSREVWVPPGYWQDVWDGTLVHGPRTIKVTRPYDQQPMWYRREGGLFVICDRPGYRVADGDWATLTVEAFPSLFPGARTTQRSIFERGQRPNTSRTDLTLRTYDSGDKLRLDIAASAVSRAWVVRFHLLPGVRAASATVDGAAVRKDLIQHIAPRQAAGSAPPFPFGGAGEAPARNAGHVLQLHIPRGSEARAVEVYLHISATAHAVVLNQKEIGMNLLAGAHSLALLYGHGHRPFASMTAALAILAASCALATMVGRAWLLWRQRPGRAARPLLLAGAAAETSGMLATPPVE